MNRFGVCMAGTGWSGTAAAAFAAFLFLAPGIAMGQAPLHADREHAGPGRAALLAWPSAEPGVPAGRKFSGDGIGGTPGEFGSRRKPSGDNEAPGRPHNIGRKLKAGALSAVLPGAGQYYNGHRNRAYLMAGIEGAIWTAFFVFDAQGDSRMETAREWAGFYAGTNGSHVDSYWQNVGHYMDSDAYNDTRYREARALDEPVSGLVGPDAAWQWVNEDRRYGYAKLRADGNSAYDRRDFMILFAVVNRAVAVVDAVMGAGNHDGNLKTEVLGFGIELELNPVYPDPGGRCVLSRSF